MPARRAAQWLLGLGAQLWRRLAAGQAAGRPGYPPEIGYPPDAPSAGAPGAAGGPRRHGPAGEGASEPNPRERAKQRLRVVLARDRVGVAPDFFAGLRHDLLDAAQRYAEIDERRAQVFLEEADGLLAVRATLPILRLKRPPPAAAGGTSRTA